MSDFKHYFDKAISYDDYVEVLGDQFRAHDLHYKRCCFDDKDKETIAGFNPVNVLVLTEPWCGDSLAIFPVVRKFTTFNPNWNFRALLRDKNLDLMDQHLTKGGRAVPLFFFLDAGYSLLLKWGPRPKKAQQIFEDHRQMINEGQIEKREVIKKIRTFYSKDKGVAIVEELLETIGGTKGFK